MSGDNSRRPEIVQFDATNRRRDKMRHLAGQEPRDGVAVPANDGQESLRADLRTAVRTTDPGLSPRQAITRETDPVSSSVASSAPVQRQPATGDSGNSPVVQAKPAQTNAAAAEKPELKAVPAETLASPEKLKIDISELEAVLVNFVVEQTGYPAEMVELDADLEADLGIDSIKKAQMLGELAEQLDVKINISEDMSLDDFPTLRHITEFLRKAGNETEVSAVIEKTEMAFSAASTIRSGSTHSDGTHSDGIRFGPHRFRRHRLRQRNSAPPIFSSCWSILSSSRPVIRLKWWKWMPTLRRIWVSTASRRRRCLANWPNN